MSFTCGMSVLLLMLPGSDPIRAELPLDGDWEFQRVTELTEPPTGGEWSACKVPGYLAGTDYQCVWLRRSFTIPSAMRGQRIKLHFGGVKYNSRIYVNGQHVGGCFGGYEAFDIDVTSAVQLDQPNTLVVGCHDWTGVFAPGRVKFPADTAWDATRGVPADKILSPVGGLYGLFGIWDEVLLWAHPAVYVKDVFVEPSVRRHELVIDYSLANESDCDVRTTLRSVVEDGGHAVWLPRVLGGGGPILLERRADQLISHFLVAAPGDDGPRHHSAAVGSDQTDGLRGLSHSHPAVARAAL